MSSDIIGHTQADDKALICDLDEWVKLLINILMLFNACLTCFVNEVDNLEVSKHFAMWMWKVD